MELALKKDCRLDIHIPLAAIKFSQLKRQKDEQASLFLNYIKGWVKYLLIGRQAIITDGIPVQRMD